MSQHLSPTINRGEPTNRDGGKVATPLRQCNGQLHLRLKAILRTHAIEAGFQSLSVWDTWGRTSSQKIVLNKELFPAVPKSGQWTVMPWTVHKNR